MIHTWLMTVRGAFWADGALWHVCNGIYSMTALVYGWSDLGSKWHWLIYMTDCMWINLVSWIHVPWIHTGLHDSATHTPINEARTMGLRSPTTTRSWNHPWTTCHICLWWQTWGQAPCNDESTLSDIDWTIRQHAQWHVDNEQCTVTLNNTNPS